MCFFLISHIFRKMSMSVNKSLAITLRLPQMDLDRRSPTFFTTTLVDVNIPKMVESMSEKPKSEF